MKQAIYGNAIIAVIIAVLAFLPSTTGASGEVEYTTDPVILPGYDELNMFGSLVHYYPLDVPAGRHGLQPELKLIYNNVNSLSGNILGAGWSLSLPTIERVNKHGTDVLYDQADFTSSLSGELIQIAENSYGAKVDDGSFLDYELSSTGWKVTAKDGLTYTFGDTANTRLTDPVDSTKIHTWYLTTIRDTNGNFITYSYEKDDSNNAVYPETITYTNDASGTGPYTITFTRETRSDSSVSYAAGWLTHITERISTITITVNDSNVKTYQFGYSAGDNGVRSLLSTISASGENTAGTTVTLPDMNYAYTAGDATLTYNAEINFPNVTWTDTNGQEQTAPFAFSDDYVQVMDVNGDGLQDIVKSYNTQVGGVDYPIFWVLINTGHGWEIDISWTQPEYTYVNGDGTSLTEKFTFGSEEVIGDWNGDAKDDLMLFWAEDIGGGENLQQAVVLLNTGDGWEQDTSVTADSATITNDDGTAELYVEFGSGHFVDLNGDGLLDFVSATSTQTNGVYDPHFAVWYNQNGSLVWDDTVAVPWVEYTASGSTESAPLNFTSSVRLLEVNGDGLIDFLYANNYQINGVDQPSFWVLINNGHGWTQDTTITHPTYEYLDLSNTTTTSYVSTSTDWSIIDVNGDYLSDLVTLSSTEVSGVRYDRTSVLINTGNGWTQDDALLTVGDYEYTDTNNTVQTGFPTTGSTALFFDVNGDGLDDIVNAEYSQSGGTYYTRNWLMENTGDTANLLEEILLPTGGQYTFTYKSSSEYTDDDGQLLNQNLPATYNTLFSVTSDDGTGTTATTTYEYADGSFYYADQYDRRFAGFGMVTETDATGQKKIIYYHQGNGLQTDERGSDVEDGSMMDKMYREEVYDSTNNLYRVQLHNWQSADLGNDRTFVYLEEELELLYDGDADYIDTATSYSYDTTTGNISTQTDSGEATGSDDDRTTTYAYATDASGVIISQPTTITLTDADGITVSETRYTYDGLTVGSVETGNITQEESWISDTDYAATSYTYDAYGNVLTQTDPLGNTTTTTYDTANLYPATITNALSQTQTFEYDAAVGQPTSVTEVNGAITETDYDGLGRTIEERRSSDVTATNLETTQTWDYDDTSLPQSVTHRSYLSTTSYQEDITYIDGLNRIIETKILDAAGTAYNETETTYDALGQVSSTTLAEAAADYGYDSNTVSSDLAESYTYDALGRVTAVTNVLGATTTDYDGFTKTVTDALNNQKDYITDGLGRLVSVIEYVDGAAYTTNYTWDAADHLITTSDALGNIRNFTYDGRGLRLTAEDLHDSTDTTFGTWIYTYDDAGNLSTSLSPNNITVTSGYDELNRQTTETDITYTYDSCTNGTGKLCTATTNDAVTTTSSYTASGRLSTETKTISAIDYTTSYTYDTLGNILTTTHPDGTVITNTYNVIGSLATVTGSDAVVTDTTYGPHGQITSQTNANGTTTTYTYNENERYRSTGKLTTGYEEGDTTTLTTTTTASFYPTTGDGYVYKSNAAWDTAHDATSGSSQTSTTTSLINGITKSTTSYYLYRTFLPFDTSALPDDATITSATLNVYVYSKKNNDNDGDDFMTVVPTTQASTTTLSTADFDQTGSIDNPTEGIDTTERKDITTVSTNAYLTFNLNSTGRDWISKTAITKLGLREGHDVIDSAFTSTSTTTSQYNTLYLRSAEYAGTTYDPYLEVTYTQTSTTEAEPVVSTLQDLSYTYDATGNITQIVDASDVDSAKTTDYTYDDLYRLTSTTTSGAANGDNTTITYAYDAIGNTTSRSDVGTYAYDNTDYANSHAVTNILMTDGTTITYSYDNNGNLTSDGSKNYAWDYKNRLTSSGELTETTSTTTTTATTNFYPTTGDGYTYKSNASWDTAHDATSGSGATATATSAMVGTYKSTSAYSLARAFLPFDTSSLPDDATITSATLKMYVYSKTNNDNDGDDWVTVVQGSQPSTSTLTTADYDLAGSVNSPTEGIETSERKDITSVMTNAYLSLALNSVGLGWISNTATTKLALREGHDVIDSAFTSDSTTATRYNRLYYRASEYAGTTYDPYLEVTYTQPSTVTTTTTTHEVSYVYDHTNQRVSKSSEDATTYYPSDDYSITADTSTTSVSGPTGLTAVIEYDGTTSTTETIHTDHLGSTNVVTDEDGVMIELLDYHPYGDERISWSSSSESGEAESQQTFIGEYSDDETDLSYLNARYYDPARGQFLSQDPVFLSIGTDDKRAQTALLDPQLQNSYGYSRNNPITYIDPTGEFSFSSFFTSGIQTVQMTLSFVSILENTGKAAVALSTGQLGLVALYTTAAVANLDDTMMNSANALNNLVNSFTDQAPEMIQTTGPISDLISAVAGETAVDALHLSQNATAVHSLTQDAKKLLGAMNIYKNVNSAGVGHYTSQWINNYVEGMITDTTIDAGNQLLNTELQLIYGSSKDAD